MKGPRCYVLMDGRLVEMRFWTFARQDLQTTDKIRSYWADLKVNNILPPNKVFTFYLEDFEGKFKEVTGKVCEGNRIECREEPKQCLGLPR